MNKKNEQVDQSLPLFQRPFRTRVSECWETFSKGEAKLRLLIDQKADSESITELLDSLLTPAFEIVYAEVGFNGEKHELILNLEGDWSRLFALTYFQKQAPESVLAYWDILVGRQSRGEKLENYQLRIADSSVCAGDIQVWTSWENQKAKVSLYCKDLVPLLSERKSEAYWLAYVMLDYAVGELAEMEYIRELEILHTPYAEPAFTLVQLMPHFMEQLSLSREALFDAGRYCELYCGYRMEPNEEAHDGLRGDVFVGSGCFVPLLNEFWSGENRIMDTFHADGIAAGYFCFPLYGFEGDDRGAQILDFRDNAAEMIEKTAGLDNFTYIGGASGIYYGYLDFIAWDLKAVLDAAVSVFKQSGIDWVMFHTFRKDADGITLFEKKTE
ncbi:MAG: hypothetical protein K2O91_17300 [Lachnospiraceae bacterium]|nr:hypothetical protein [Lachnospiraceae bacterium]